MKMRSKKIIALLLSASLIFSFNTFAFGEEVGESGVEAELDSVLDAVGDEEAPAAGEEEAVVDEFAAVDEIADVDADTGNKPKDIPNALSGNVTIATGTPYLNVKTDFTVSVDDVEKAIAEQLTFTIGSTTYNVSGNQLFMGVVNPRNLVSSSNVTDYLNISLNKIRKAGAKISDGTDLKYTDNRTTITDVKGNQLVTFKATINTTKDAKATFVPYAKSNTVEGEVLLKSPYSGSVSEQRVTFSNGKYSLVVTYDAAVEYRGNRVTATSHYLVLKEDEAQRMGEVDGSVGVGARFEVLSADNVWYPIDKDNKDDATKIYGFGSYYWKDDNGITINLSKLYNNKNVGSMYDESGPYFTLKMSYKKKQGEKELLTQSDKLSLKNALKTQKFHFAIEPKRISSELITYSKNEPDKYYVKKLTYKTEKNTLGGDVQFRGQKRDKKTLNARKMTNVGKKLKIVSKSSHESTPKDKTDAYFIYNDGKVTLTGVNGYYGSAVIDQNIKVK